MTIPDNPYGATCGALSAPQASPQAKAQQVCNDLVSQGCAWLRWQIAWKFIDPGANGNYTTGANLTLTGMDDIVTRANAAGLNLCLSIEQPPGDNSAGTGYCTQLVTGSSPAYYYASQSKTHDFAKFIATRYNGGARGTVQCIDIGNEDYDPVSTPEYPRVQGGKYLALNLNASYADIKAANPSCLVLAGCVLQTSDLAHLDSWMQNFLNNNGHLYCDAIQFHFYRSGGTPPIGKPPDQGTTITQVWQEISAQLSSFSVTKQVWCGECGYGVDSVDQAHQSQYMLEEYDSMSGSNGVVTHAFYYTLGGQNTTNDDHTITQHGYDGPTETFNTVFNAITNYITNKPQWTTTGGVTPSLFTVYLTAQASSTLGTANTLYTSSSANTPNQNNDTKIGAATGWGEITAQGTASAWAALGAEFNPTGKGFFLDPTTLEGQQIIAGVWTAGFRLNVVGTGAVALTSDLYCRAWKYSGGVYTLIAKCALSAQSVKTTKTTFTPNVTTVLDTSFGVGDKLYIDYPAHITANSNPGTTSIRFNDLSTDSAGQTGEDTGYSQLVTPGYQAAGSNVPPPQYPSGYQTGTGNPGFQVGTGNPGSGPSGGHGIYTNQQKIGNWVQSPPSLLRTLEQDIYRLFKWFEDRL